MTGVQTCALPISVRARRTAEVIAAITGARLLLDSRLYHAAAVEIIDALPGVIEQDVATVMVVGHNPGLEELIAHLTGEREALPTAALAQIPLPIERWSELDLSTRGTLVRLWRPKELA